MKTPAVAVWRFPQFALAVAISLALSETALATGFFINQQSVRGLGRVDAGNTVAADELGTIFFNPAGLALLVKDPQDRDCIRVSLASHLIIPRSEQRYRTATAATPGTLGAFLPIGGGNARNPTDPTPVPNIYVAAPLGNRAAVGMGINVPFGLETKFDPDWHGRYDAIEASLRTINLSLVGAYRFDTGLSIGGGLDLQYAQTSLTTAIPNPLLAGGPTASTDARIETKGSDSVTPGFNAGFMYDVSERARVGAHYRSGMTHKISGTSVVGGLPAPLAAFNGSVGATAEIKLPAITTAGVRANITPDLVLLGEFEWFNWSTFDEVRIRFADGRPDGVRPAGYRDAYAVAMGAEYPVRPNWTARGGVHFDTTPTVDGFRDTTVPDSERVWLGLGATFNVTKIFHLDVAFNHVFFRDTTIALTRTFFDGTPLASAVNVNSDVNTVVNTLAIDFGFTF